MELAKLFDERIDEGWFGALWEFEKFGEEAAQYVAFLKALSSLPKTGLPAFIAKYFSGLGVEAKKLHVEIKYHNIVYVELGFLNVVAQMTIGQRFMKTDIFFGERKLTLMCGFSYEELTKLPEKSLVCLIHAHLQVLKRVDEDCQAHWEKMEAAGLFRLEMV